MILIAKKGSPLPETALSKRASSNSGHAEMKSAGLGKIEKREMKEFIVRTWKELLLMEIEEKKQKNKPELIRRKKVMSSRKDSKGRTFITSNDADVSRMPSIPASTSTPFVVTSMKEALK